MEFQIRHEERDRRFVATADGLEGYLRYRPAGSDTLDLVSTFVPPELRGRGMGESLVKAALDHARERGYDVIPTCWFVDTVLDRNPGYRELLAE